jgi:nicotinamide mononucleotide (NMN) deamidase PncC
MQTLAPVAEALAERLKGQRQTVAVAESSTGGLISAALLAVPGASAYFLGGAVVYTRAARRVLLGIADPDVAGIRGATEAFALLLNLPREAVAGMRSASEPYALLLARSIREQFEADWGISETGAAGPTGNPYGDAAGHSCVAVSGPVELVLTLETGQSDRSANMVAFAQAALDLFLKAASGD